MQNLIIYTDGGARGNPGPAAIGVVIYFRPQPNQPYKKIHAFGKIIGHHTNNEAEYTAVIEAWRWLVKNKNKFSSPLTIDFYLDSYIVVNQLLGRYKIRGPNLTDYLFTVKKLQQQFIKSTIDYHYVVRQENMEADYWVNQALDKKI